MYTTAVQVPLREEESSAGTVMTTQIQCIKEAGCIWNPGTHTCDLFPTWEQVPYSMADKIIVGTTECPAE
jgi:hypothetical protein